MDLETIESTSPLMAFAMFIRDLGQDPIKRDFRVIRVAVLTGIDQLLRSANQAGIGR